VAPAVVPVCPAAWLPALAVPCILPAPASVAALAVPEAQVAVPASLPVPALVLVPVARVAVPAAPAAFCRQPRQLRRLVVPRVLAQAVVVVAVVRVTRRTRK
jgi:hypothetical protein